MFDSVYIYSVIESCYRHHYLQDSGSKRAHEEGLLSAKARQTDWRENAREKAGNVKVGSEVNHTIV